MLPAAILAVVLAAQAAAARDTAPDDAYRDPGVRGLVERARAMRGREAAGIESYAATLRERLYVGLSAFRFRRERALLQQERAARIWWGADTIPVVKWLGARRRLPILGPHGNMAIERERTQDEQGERVRGEVRIGGKETEDSALQHLRRELEREVPPVPLDPGGDQLFFLGSGRTWALHPLSDTAHYHYRFRSGDTLRIRLPTREEPITLVEAIVEPRQARFDRVAGSLWFDAESGRIVRATLRPARAFDLDVDEPDDARDVPRFIKPVQVGIDYITMDYSLQQMRWWLPRRMALRGEVRVGRLLSVPVTFEWVISEYAVNEAATNPDPGATLPSGWSRTTASRRRRQHAPERRFTVLVPPAESLAVAPELPDAPFEREPLGFDPQEIAELRERLGEMAMPGFRSPARLTWGWAPGAGLARYNRVEGLAVGAKLAVPITSRAEASLTGIVGTADAEPSGELRIARTDGDRTLSLVAYRDLAWVGDWDRPLSLASSLSALVLGSDDNHYYRAAGVRIEGRETGGFLRSEWRIFAERHNSAAKHTDFSLAKLVGSDSAFAANPPIEPGRSAGVSAGVRIQSGVDPSRLLGSARIWGEAAAGDFDYRRLAGTVAVARPLFRKLAAALEAGAGTSWGHLPVQRDYALGGPRTLRGFSSLALRGPAFWIARAELANGFPGARLAVFYDAGWAGPREEFAVRGYAAGAGAGLSLLDGIMRLDVARALKGGAGWRVHLYVDGLF
ncbi:MAG: BamA/TamA family outer membrane protein [Gemmatimonadetes bacterium]|nr:BamA/TamA family outer membrane protein [Gemmatimonadota bacterium]